MTLVATMILCASVPAIAADHYCTTAAQLTTALTNASLTTNDTITLDAASTFEAPSGGWVLPNKTGTGWITIRSSAHASLPAAGTRVNLTHANVMPLLRPSNTTSPVFKTVPSAHHYKLIGLEITGPTADTQPDGFSDISHPPITLGTSGTDQDTLPEVPNNFVIDRCIVRANSATQRIRRGIALDSASTDITNCYIAGFKDVDVSDSQAIACFNGPGPFNIINNFLEGAGENIIFGGAVPTVPNLVPSDIVIQRNHFHKPLTWNKYNTAANGFPPPHWDGTSWIIKNLFEIKNGRRITLEGNILENHPGNQGQPGWCIVLTPATQPGAAPWTVVEDVVFQNNIIRRACLGPNIYGFDQHGDPTEQSKRITFENNLFYDIGGTLWGGGGKLFQVMRAVDTLVLNHNTCFQTGTAMSFDVAPSPGFVAVNNIFNREGGFGIWGASPASPAEGNSALATWAPGAIFTKNVLKNGTASRYDQYPNNFSPTSLGFPTTWDFLQNYTTPGTNFAGWKVDVGSAYDNSGMLTTGTGSDGKDIGCDIDQLNTVTAGCISGVWSSALPVASDSFGYTGGLNGKAGGTGFGTNGWTLVSPYADIALTPSSLAYSNGSNAIITNGNHLAPAANTRLFRNFTSTVTTANTTKWASFRIKRAPGTFPSNHAGFILMSGVGGTGNEIFFGKPASGTNWGIFHSATNSTAIASGTPQYDAFLVAKMVFTSSTVTIQMWVNPVLVEGSLGTAQATLSNKAHTTNFASLRVSTGTNSTGYEFDEFRLGDTFGSVTD